MRAQLLHAPDGDSTVNAPPCVVVLKEQGTVFGPFATRTEAAAFAAFATREIDPAEVRMLCSPVAELLSWRDMMLKAKT